MKLKKMIAKLLENPNKVGHIGCATGTEQNDCIKTVKDELLRRAVPFKERGCQFVFKNGSHLYVFNLLIAHDVQFLENKTADYKSKYKPFRLAEKQIEMDSYQTLVNLVNASKIEIERKDWWFKQLNQQYNELKTKLKNAETVIYCYQHEITDLKAENEKLKKQLSEIKNSDSLTEHEVNDAFYFTVSDVIEGHYIIKSFFSIPKSSKTTVFQAVKDFLANKDEILISKTKAKTHGVESTIKNQTCSGGFGSTN